MTPAADNPEAPGLPAGWKALGRGNALHRRFEFDNYAATSAFLAALAQLSERTGLYPDLSFASRHVNATIPAGEEGREMDQAADFASEANRIFEGSAG